MYEQMHYGDFNKSGIYDSSELFCATQVQYNPYKKHVRSSTPYALYVGPALNQEAF